MHAPLTATQLVDLPDTTHPATGITFPPLGLSPYHDWLLQTLHRLSETSFAALLVSASTDSSTSVFVAPGRVSLDATEYVFPGSSLELATFNNDQALVYLQVSSGSVVAGANTVGAGWPVGTHLPLARVTLAGGEVTQVDDLRLLSLFTA